MATAITTPCRCRVPGADFHLPGQSPTCQRHLGGIPIERIRLFPHPLSSATIVDLERQLAQNDRLLELIDGVLVEKTIGYYESLLAAVFIRIIGNYLDKNNIGILLSSDGTLRNPCHSKCVLPMFRSLIGDIFSTGKLPREAFPSIAPDLAIEILSPSNTTAEMNRKRGEYFRAGTKLVWYVDPDPKTVTVYRPVGEPTVLKLENEIDGGDVLPGFRLSVRELFALAGERE